VAPLPRAEHRHAHVHARTSTHTHARTHLHDAVVVQRRGGEEVDPRRREHLRSRVYIRLLLLLIGVPPGTREVQHMTCSIRHATYDLQDVACSMLHAACCMQHVTCNIRHAACDHKLRGSSSRRQGRTMPTAAVRLAVHVGPAGRQRSRSSCARRYSQGGTPAAARAASAQLTAPHGRNTDVFRHAPHQSKPPTGR
jgi:hypothetical protein